jgi:hypothetical protein
MNERHGSCHCGRIRLAFRDESIEISECNCSACRRTAGLWHYCPPEMLSVEGEGVAYRQGDHALDLWHCPVCGCTTHWTPTGPAYPRMGINLRMFEPDLWRYLPRRLVDGASY